jgi:hypothetical protein
MARMRCSQSAMLTPLESLDSSDSSEFVDPFVEWAQWRHWPLQRQAIPARQVCRTSVCPFRLADTSDAGNPPDLRTRLHQVWLMGENV